MAIHLVLLFCLGSVNSSDLSDIFISREIPSEESGEIYSSKQEQGLKIFSVDQSKLSQVSKKVLETGIIAAITGRKLGPTDKADEFLLGGILILRTRLGLDVRMLI